MKLLSDAHCCASCKLMGPHVEWLDHPSLSMSKCTEGLLQVGGFVSRAEEDAHAHINDPLVCLSPSASGLQWGCKELAAISLTCSLGRNSWFAWGTRVGQMGWEVGLSQQCRIKSQLKPDCPLVTLHRSCGLCTLHFPGPVTAISGSFQWKDSARTEVGQYKSPAPSTSLHGFISA